MDRAEPLVSWEEQPQQQAEQLPQPPLKPAVTNAVGESVPRRSQKRPASPPMPKGAARQAKRAADRLDHAMLDEAIKQLQYPGLEDVEIGMQLPAASATASSITHRQHIMQDHAPQEGAVKASMRPPDGMKLPLEQMPLEQFLSIACLQTSDPTPRTKVTAARHMRTSQAQMRDHYNRPDEDFDVNYRGDSKKLARRLDELQSINGPPDGEWHLEGLF
ncbi:hypothetical protein WJX84_000873 [Apatococcus fuscideae]|uniref:Uncharacterized protein n=1 Tax=Apatococcus fuscideae TaxID=2026836 RepID=A0AAW1TI66_9CHLO